MSITWVDRSRDVLLSIQGERPGWGYRAEGEPYVEPTALASLALLATAQESPNDPGIAAAQAAADWLAEIQQPDGALGLSESLAEPCWGTALGLLLWSALAAYEKPREKATRWLLDLKGETQPKTDEDVFEHDSSIVGWPWTRGTAAWVEPTAWAVLALRRQGLSDHVRVREGLRVIRDRAVPTGGWNVGNNVTFGNVLRSQPAPTGWALLALAPEDADRQVVNRGCAYLEKTLPTIRSPRSMACGLLGLAAWGKRPKAADSWLLACEPLGERCSKSPAELAYLLLAGASRPLELFGINADHGGHANGSPATK